MATTFEPQLEHWIHDMHTPLRRRPPCMTQNETLDTSTPVMKVSAMKDMMMVTMMNVILNALINVTMNAVVDYLFLKSYFSLYIMFIYW